MPTALIVEDEPAANKLLAMLVQLHGYETESAFDGRQALELVERSAPDIVFLDLMLPDVNGYEVCQAIKANPLTALIPVVMVTARIALENRILSYAIGADGYIAKPYTPGQIFEALDEARSWDCETDGPPPQGVVAIGSCDGGETLRRLARLRSLVVARTPLDAEAADALSATIREVAADGDAWGAARGLCAVGSLEYAALPDRLEFRVLDHSGWLLDPGSETLVGLLRAGGLDPVWRDPCTGTIHFARRFLA